MMVSTIKLAALLLCINLGKSKAKECSDCIPLRNCKEASKLMASLTDDNMRLLRLSYCGSSSRIRVCCSDFEMPEIPYRGGPEQNESKKTTEHPSIRLLPNFCGEINENRILGGRIADLYEFPWMALISYNIDGGHQFKCAGTLINSHYVLTAAHCVEGLNIAGVRIGEYDLRYDIDCVKGVCEEHIQDRRVEQQIVHEKYRGQETNYEHDIALLRLRTQVSLTPHNAGTICLPVTNELRQASIADKNATVAGWGITEFNKESTVLLKVRIPVHSNDICKKSYSHSQMDNPDPTQFCAGDFEKDSCQGDSGGPLLIEDMYQGSWKYIQYGIVSVGPGHCGRSTPGIYTDVRKYVDWILNKIKE